MDDPEDAIGERPLPAGERPLPAGERPLPAGERPLPAGERPFSVEGGLLERIHAQLSERELRIATLEADITRLHDHIAALRPLDRDHRVMLEALDGMVQAVAGFRQAVRRYDRGATMDDALRIARHRFILRLSSPDLQPLPAEAGASLRSSAEGLARILSELRRDLTAIADAIATGAGTHRELERAGALQRALVPPPEHTIPGLELHAWFQPAGQCGGDWWSAVPLSDRLGLLVLGDVTGHSAPAAVLTGVAGGALQVARMGLRDTLEPAQLLRMLNHAIRESARGVYMMTTVALRVVAGGGPCTLSSAGHLPPLLIHDGQVTVLHGAREPALGAIPGYPYRQRTFEASPGDRIVLYTDGITEAEDSAHSQLSERAIRTVVEAHRGHGARALRDAIRSTVLGHRGSAPQHDDVCLVVGEFV